ncbi:FliH/SctL family protein [Scatolibacter rhodanostii]|uniref:FliH/SctL family protein n=1 Tax=Scatolibacter rhodanostii TaxID=2014781 RepID=UPI000C07EFB8|nr:FliH/SctL family protein [Scatolibacter rhodanostii]
MPDIIKQQGAFPVRGSVSIPDVIFENPVKAVSSIENQEETEEKEDSPEEFSNESDLEQVRTSTREPILMSREEIAQYHEAELAEICREAEQRAYSDALRQRRSELTASLEQVDNLLAEMQVLQEEYMKRYAREMKYMAIDIAEKMIMTKIAENDMLLSNLVMHMVSNVKNASWLNVEVSERLVSLVEFLKEELAKTEYHGRASVTPTVCGNDTCRVSTEEGTAVATISVQAQNLKEAFRAAEAE